MAYAEKRGSGKYPWRARYKRPDGTLGSEPGFRTKKAAEEWGDDQEAAIRAGRWQDPEKARTPFGEFTPVWMAAQKVAPATSNKRRYLLNRHLLPAFERTPLCEINIFTAQAWANKQTCAASTVGSALTLLSSILTGAADAGYLLANPMYGRRRQPVDRPEHDVSKQHGAVDHVRDGAKEVVWAQPEDVFALYQRLGGVAGLMVVTAAYTGLRWGELSGLHRSNVLLKRPDKVSGRPFERTVLRIDPVIGSLHEVEFEADEAALVAWNAAEDQRLAECREKRWKANRRREPKTIVKLYLGPPKNKTSAREVDLPPFLVELLEKHLASWPHDYVFATEADGKWWRRGNFGRSHLRPAADGRTEIPRKRGFAGRKAWEPIAPGLTMHGLRHSHDTWMKDERVDRALRFETMGWAVSGDIEGVYEHVTPEMRKQRLEALESRWRRGRRVALRAVG
ncbi:tyrosine-type recombinase/integrase [Streptomyces shenzhenensis]|uniref:tyrosine-type recombinase/integrase n=1 Tax=Streptomyces shenzhenensis TaxID=943815 RepID=UPI00368C64A3